MQRLKATEESREPWEVVEQGGRVKRGFRQVSGLEVCDLEGEKRRSQRD